MRWPEHRVPSQTPMMACFAMRLTDAGAIRLRAVQRKSCTVRQNQRTEEREKRFEPLHHQGSCRHFGIAPNSSRSGYSNVLVKSAVKESMEKELRRGVTSNRLRTRSRSGPWVWSFMG